jgi:Domain of unknown function (DUF4159)
MKTVGMLLIACVAMLGLAAALLAQGVDMPTPKVAEEDVRDAIRRMVDFQYKTMSPRGDWEEVPNRAGYNKHKYASKKKLEYGGRTALVVLSLLYAGEDHKDERLGKTMAFLKEAELTGTYASSIRASVWSKIFDPKMKPLLKRDARFLVDAMTKIDGTIPGFFAYHRPCPGYGDHSNTQYGVLGLRDAAIRGVEIPLKYWEAIEKHMINLQWENGGWSYRIRRGDGDRQPYGNMTVGCLANLYITLDMLQVKYEGAFNGKSAKGCGRRKPPAAIDKGLAWLDENMPDHTGNMGLYFLYGLERCAHASGRKTFGGKNWFEEGAQWVLRQLGSKDSIGSYRGPNIPTAWAILFLSKGQAPIFYNKLDTGADWCNKLRDISTVSKYIGHELEQRVNWQVIDIDAPVETWLDAPILFFSGHDIPPFTDEEKKKLRLYTDSGGTIVAQACCSKREFTRGFQKLAEEVWPEWELQRLDRKHPVMSAHHEIRGRLPQMLHIHDGCRSRVFLVTQGMAGAWNQNLQKRYKTYFQLGMNLARYASDKRMLRSRLAFYAKPVLVELARQGKPVPDAGGEAEIALADYPTDGKRLTAIRGLRHLAELLKEATGVNATRHVMNDHTLDGLDGAQVVRMSGLHTFSVSDANIEKLRTFVKRGGLIVADAQTGRKGFRDSFPAFVEKLLPGAKLAKVPQTDPVITGQGLSRTGFDATKVRYTRALKFTRFRAELEEVRLDGRRVILYSPYDLTVGLDGMDCWGSEGLVRNDALKLWTNIVLSALPKD